MKALTCILSAIFILVQSTCSAGATIVREEKIYKEVGGIKLTAHIFYSGDTQKKKGNPAIAFLHGGGWVFGSPSEFFGACERYAEKGFVTISFQYRLSINEDGTYPRTGISPVESVMDARSAIRWLRENAASLKIDPDKIIVSGQSAGGQLALSTALMDNINEASDNLNFSPVPNALLLYSSSVNAMEAWVDMLLGDRREMIWDISPYHNLKKNMPPVVAFHGQDDDTVLPYIVDLFKVRMTELGNYYDLTTYPGRKHYLGEGNEKYSRYFDEEILEKTDVFLRKFGFMPEGN